jgi:hypothetical protein
MQPHSLSNRFCRLLAGSEKSIKDYKGISHVAWLGFCFKRFFALPPGSAFSLCYLKAEQREVTKLFSNNLPE